MTSEVRTVASLSVGRAAAAQLKRVAGLAAAAVGFAHGTITLTDGRGHRVVASTYSRSRVIGQWLVALATEVTTTGAAVVRADAAAQIASYVGVPVTVDGQVAGDLVGQRSRASGPR